MRRHSTDLLSLVAGLAFLGLGLVLLAGGVRDIQLEWVGPIVAIGAGSVILVAARSVRDTTHDEPKVSDEA